MKVAIALAVSAAVISGAFANHDAAAVVARKRTQSIRQQHQHQQHRKLEMSMPTYAPTTPYETSTPTAVAVAGGDDYPTYAPTAGDDDDTVTSTTSTEATYDVTASTTTGATTTEATFDDTMSMPAYDDTASTNTEATYDDTTSTTTSTTTTAEEATTTAAAEEATTTAAAEEAPLEEATMNTPTYAPTAANDDKKGPGGGEKGPGGGEKGPGGEEKGPGGGLEFGSADNDSEVASATASSNGAYSASLCNMSWMASSAFVCVVTGVLMSMVA
jgi:hypothetical protein